jgi:predicted chitinase
MELSKETLVGLGVRSDRADKYLEALNQALQAGGIDTPLRIAHFLAQVLHESAKLRWVEENLNYSAEALLKVFGKYFTRAQAQRYARKPRLIGSRVYANRMGNGDEASGDGYRYSGRGLIQLTGKNNYRAFSRWMEDDVVEHPELVADRYAVHSAVYYWTSHDINAPADLDDVRTVTRKINGGLNGLSDRMDLLEKAKQLLSVEAPALSLEEVSHEVTATQLNLRSQPRVSPSTWLGTLDQGMQVVKLGRAAVPGWSRVRALLNGSLTEGFVASRHLKPVPRGAEVVSRIPEVESLPSVHMKQARRDITRERDGGRAYPLGEGNMPRRRGGGVEVQVRGLLSILDFLNCENPGHLRYQPKRGTTYCNIYAYDYCYLANIYLPRVWWADRALTSIRAGGNAEVRYADTVRELNANALYDWFGDFGTAFGWKRVMNIDELQAAANNGEACIIVGQHNDLNRSGHIAVVAPEQQGLAAKRSASGEVKVPVQSQAGRNNFRCSTAPGRWWAGAQFRSFSFWRHS